MKMKQLVIFLTINLMALVLSRIIMVDGLQSDWYTQTPKAPWTPPAWSFGVAWSIIMTAFAVYLAKLSTYGALTGPNRYAYAAILLLCIVWNAVFFAWQAVVLGVLVLVALALCVTGFTIANYAKMRGWSVLMAPFIIWSCIATSLNIYSAVYG